MLAVDVNNPERVAALEALLGRIHKNAQAPKSSWRSHAVASAPTTDVAVNTSTWVNDMTEATAPTAPTSSMLDDLTLDAPTHEVMREVPAPVPSPRPVAAAPAAAKPAPAAAPVRPSAPAPVRGFGGGFGGKPAEAAKAPVAAKPAAPAAGGGARGFGARPSGIPADRPFEKHSPIVERPFDKAPERAPSVVASPVVNVEAAHVATPAEEPVTGLDADFGLPVVEADPKPIETDALPTSVAPEPSPFEADFGSVVEAPAPALASAGASADADTGLPLVEPEPAGSSAIASLLADVPPPPALESEPVLAPLAIEPEPVAAAPEPEAPKPVAAAKVEVEPPPSFTATAPAEPVAEAPSKFVNEPAEPAKKKSSLGLVVGIAFVVLAAGAGVFYFLRAKEQKLPQNTPAPTAEPAKTAAAKPTATSTAIATATATATAAESAAPATSSSAAADPSAPPKDPKSLPGSVGYLVVTAPEDADVLIGGKSLGATKTHLEVSCMGTKFVSLAKSGTTPPKMFGRAKSVSIACQSVTNLEFTAADMQAPVGGGGGAAPPPTGGGAPPPGPDPYDPPAP